MVLKIKKRSIIYLSQKNELKCAEIDSVCMSVERPSESRSNRVRLSILETINIKEIESITLEGNFSLRTINSDRLIA